MSTFWKPRTVRPGSFADRASESFPSLLPSPSPSSSTALPILSSRLAILHALETHQVLILIAPTGSGKSTLLPQLLHSAGYSAHGAIAITQPRRITAVSLSSHVAASLKVRLGQEVGYTIRFEENATEGVTKIKYMTDGSLFRVLVRDPLLTRYSVVVVDEAHERGMYTDLLLGVLRKIVRKRPELRVVVSSATIDAEVFKDFFDESVVVTNTTQSKEEERAKILKIQGRSFPVHIAYLTEPCSDYVMETVETIWKIHLGAPQGDILAFLTGQAEIQSALQTLSDRQLDLPSGAAMMHLLPLHSQLNPAEQAAIFDPPPTKGHRKVVIATNIAEASITLPSVRYVVDCGLVKTRILNAHTGMEALCIVPISLASATQRAGRAGRVSEGKCFRLYTEAYFSTHMRATNSPELTRTDLSAPILMLKSLGIDNLVRFEWVPPSPPPEMVAKALEGLFSLGVVDEYARLTEAGSMISELPLAPHLGKVLIESVKRGCAKEVLSILAMMQVSHPFFAPDSAQTQLAARSFTAQEGDLFTLLNVYLAFDGIGKRSARWSSAHRLNFPSLSRALSIRGQLEKYLIRFQLDSSCSVLGEKDAVETITRTLATGLYANLARYDEASMTFTTAVGGNKVWAHPTSVLFNRRPDAGKLWLLYAEAVQHDDGKTFIRDLTVLGDLSWVTDAVPGFYKVETKWANAGSKTALSTSVD